MAKRKSLRSKLVRTMLVVTAVIGASAMVIVVWNITRASEQHLDAVQRYIEEGIVSKGMVLTENQALALRALTLDNAFTDMQQLVHDAVQDDVDVMYGLYVTSDKTTSAYSRAGLPQGEQKVPEQQRSVELDIPDEELLVEKKQIKKVHRLGTEVLEIAMPVIGDEGEPLGTIRYGLSTRRMEEALTQAREDADARVERSVLSVGSLVGLAMLLTALLSRLQAVRITRPVAELTQAAQKLSKGDRKVSVDVASGDELDDLADSFNIMVEDLDSSYRKLEDMNKNLEQRVEDRTQDLAQKNRDMRLVLDNVDQGLVTVYTDGTMAKEHSRVVEKWFGAYGDQSSFRDFVARSSQSFADVFEFGWMQLMDGILPLSLTIAQLPKRLEKGNRTWSFHYLPFHRGEELEGVLVVIDEITEQLAKERDQAEHEELLNAFTRLMNDRSGFLRFIEEADTLVKSIPTGGLEAEQKKRALHTLKGNAALMNLPMISRLAHQLEEQMLEEGHTSKELEQTLATRWERFVQQVVDLGGTKAKTVVEMSEAEHDQLLRRLTRETNATPGFLQEVRAWSFEPLSLSLGRLAREAKALAKRLGKGDIDVQVRVSPQDLRLDPKSWAPFFSELVHAVRNAVDHGLESPKERDAKRKALRGKLVLSCVAKSDAISFEIRDDGRGIDWDSVRTRARNLELSHERHDDLVAALFQSGMTTKGDATQTSGRGVGLAALKRRVDAMQGEIDVTSTRDVGTRWTIRFPHPLPRDTVWAA